MGAVSQQKVGPATKIMTCDPIVAVNDLVVLSSLADNTAVKAIDNTTQTPIIGVVIRKLTTSKCLVLFSGLYKFTIARGRLFLSGTGTLITNSPPIPGFLQELGFSTGDGDVIINIHRRIKRN